MKRFIKRGCLAALVILILGPVACSLLIPGGEDMIPQAAKEWARKHPENFATKGGVHAATAGSEKADKTVFIIHGSPGNWSAAHAYLTDETLVSDFRVISFDRPGYGKSHPGETIGSLVEQAEKLAVWAEDRPGKKIWMGHSFGAPIAAQLAIDRPDLVDGLVLSGSAMDPDLEQPRWYHHLGDTLVIRPLLPSAWRVTNEECLAFAEGLEKLASRLNEITCPVYLLHARNDRLADFRHVDWTAKQIDKPSLVTIKTFENGDHFIFWSRTDAHVEAILELSRK